jgi:hypothetical protein
MQILVVLLGGIVIFCANAFVLSDETLMNPLVKNLHRFILNFLAFNLGLNYYLASFTKPQSPPNDLVRTQATSPPSMQHCIIIFLLPCSKSCTLFVAKMLFFKTLFA